MKRITILLLALLLLIGCSSTKKIGATIEKNDSTVVEVRFEKVIEIDTCYIEIPKQSETNVTKASESFLENDYATSTAAIDSLGLLHHTLDTKPQRKPVQVQKEKTRQDSIIYRQEVVYVEKPKYIERELTWKQEAQIYGFKVMVALLLLALCIKKRKAILVLIRKLLP